MTAALAPMASWTPPASLNPAADWAARILHEAGDGRINPDDTNLLLTTVGRHRQRFAHGDPLASNALIEPGQQRVVWIDYEFAGLAPAGSDLALIGLLLGRHDPSAETLCQQSSQAAGVEDSYLAMRLLWIARERRLYQQVFDTPDAAGILGWLDEQGAMTAAGLRGAGG
jgi:hypothetical protein